MLLIISCSIEQKNFELSGKIDGLNNGKIYLLKSNSIILDSAKIDNSSTFTLKCYIEESQILTLRLDDSNLNFIGVGPKNGSLLPDYHRLDLSIHHIFNINNTTKGDVGLSVFNLYNNLNVWYYEYSFDQRPYVRQTKSYLGIVPNISFKLTF